MEQKKQVAKAIKQKGIIDVAGILKGILILIMCIALGVLMLTLVYCMPVRPGAITESDALWTTEGWYPRALVQQAMQETYFHSYYPDVLDYSTDYIMTSTALADTPKGPFISALRCRGADGDYARYWHGYIVFLRPLLYFCNLPEIRGFSMMVQLLLILWVAVLLYRKKGMGAVIPFGVAYVFMTPIALFQSLQYMAVTILMLLASVFILIDKKSEELPYGGETIIRRHYALFFMIVGIATSYFDLLTFPVMTLSIPLLLWLIIQKESTTFSYIEKVMKSALSWGIGYGVMWISKWGIASIVLQRAVWKDALHAAQKRAATDSRYGGFVTRFDTYLENLKHYEYFPYFFLITLVFLALLLIIIGGKTIATPKSAAYSLVGFSTVAWYFLLSEHTTEHHFFTYRIFAILFATIVTMLVEWLPSVFESDKSLLGMTKKAIGILVGFGCSILVVQFLKTEGYVHNGTYENFQTYEVKEELSYSLHPAHKYVAKLKVGLKTESTKGKVTVEVLDQGVPIYTANRKLARWSESNMQDFYLEHKFRNRDNIEVHIRIQNGNEPVYAMITQDEFPLQEEGSTVLDGELVEGQSLLGVTYRQVPDSKKTKALTFMTAFFISVFCGVLIQSIFVNLILNISGKRSNI